MYFLRYIYPFIPYQYKTPNLIIEKLNIKLSFWCQMEKLNNVKNKHKMVL